MKTRLAATVAALVALAGLAATPEASTCSGSGTQDDPLVNCDAVAFASEGPGVFHTRSDDEFTLDFTETEDGTGLNHLELASPGLVRGVLIHRDGDPTEIQYTAGFFSVYGADAKWRAPGGDTPQGCDAGRVVCTMPAGSYTVYVFTDGAPVSGRFDLGGEGSANISLTPTAATFTELELEAAGVDTPATRTVMTDGFELDMAPGDGMVFSWGPWIRWSPGTALVDQGVCYYPSPRDERLVSQPYLPHCPFMGANSTLIGTPGPAEAGVSGAVTFRWQSPSQAYDVSMHAATAGRAEEGGGYVLEIPYVDR